MENEASVRLLGACVTGGNIRRSTGPVLLMSILNLWGLTYCPRDVFSREKMQNSRIPVNDPTIDWDILVRTESMDGRWN